MITNGETSVLGVRANAEQKLDCFVINENKIEDRYDLAFHSRPALAPCTNATNHYSIFRIKLYNNNC